jgi:GNAT superfamily N-acetyltransferase
LTKTDPVVERFDKTRHDRSTFDCGHRELNDWLRARASPAHRVFSARVYVFHEGDGVIRGFYTLSAGSILRDDVQPKLAKGQPSQIPAILIGRFAVDVSMQGQGLGRQLLRDALERAARISDTVGIACVIVDAKDDKSRAFYERFGFVRIMPDGYRLVLPMADVLKRRPT